MLPFTPAYRTLPEVRPLIVEPLGNETVCPEHGESVIAPKKEIDTAAGVVEAGHGR